MSDQSRAPTRRRPIWLAMIVSLVWGLLALLSYSSSDAVQLAVYFLCFPGWILAYVLLGGVHSGHMDLLPILCAVLTATISFAGILLVAKLVRRRSA